MIKKAASPFDDYVLLSNGTVLMYFMINKKNLRQSFSKWYYQYFDFGKKKLELLAMSNSEQELIDYWNKIKI